MLVKLFVVKFLLEFSDGAVGVDADDYDVKQSSIYL